MKRKAACPSGGRIWEKGYSSSQYNGRNWYFYSCR